MEINGERRIAAAREEVWRALNDPDILRHCIPGCEALVAAGDNAFDGTMTARIGPVTAKFSGKVTLADLDPPNGYRLVGEGKGTAGFAKGEASVRLVAAESATVLSYSAKAQVGGKLAQVGSRLLEGTTRKLAEQFFARLDEALTVPAPAVATPVPVAGKAGVPAWTWAAILVVAVALLVWYFAS